MFQVQVSGGPVEDFAKLIVAGACRGDRYVKYPSWYDIFPLYRVFAPNVLNWTFGLLLSPNGARRTSLIGTGMPIYESPSTGRSGVESASRPLLIEGPSSTGQSSGRSSPARSSSGRSSPGWSSPPWQSPPRREATTSSGSFTFSQFSPPRQ